MSDATPQNRAADNTQRQINMLRDQKRNLDKQLASVGSQNQKLVRLLDASRQEIVKLKQTLAAEAVPPMSFGVVQQVNPGHQPVGNATGDGPVITVKPRRGMSTLMFFRLCSRACRIRIPSGAPIEVPRAAAR